MLQESEQSVDHRRPHSSSVVNEMSAIFTVEGECTHQGGLILSVSKLFILKEVLAVLPAFGIRVKKALRWQDVKAVLGVKQAVDNG